MLTIIQINFCILILAVCETSKYKCTVIVLKFYTHYLLEKNMENFFFFRKFFHKIRSRGHKTFFMLNSVEHEILNAHKYINIKKFSFFEAQMSLECYFSCS